MFVYNVFYWIEFPPSSNAKVILFINIDWCFKENSLLFFCILLPLVVKSGNTFFCDPVLCNIQNCFVCVILAEFTTPRAILTGHDCEVTCASVCAELGLVISGCKGEIVCLSEI